MPAEIHVDNQGFKLVRTTRDVHLGEVVLDLGQGGTVTPTPTRTSIRLSQSRHVEHPVGSCINHSCDPTCEIIGPYIISLRYLPKGTEVTFNYTLYEESPLANPFTCASCGLLLTGSPAPCKANP